MPGKKDRDIDNQILQRLGEWEQKEGSLPQFVELYRQLLQLRSSVRAGITLPEHNLSEEAILSQLRQGLPLLKFEDLYLDWTIVQDHFCGIIDILADYISGEVGDAQVMIGLASDVPLLRQVAGDWYQGLPLSHIASEYGIVEELLAMVIQATLRPFLMAHSELLCGLMKHELWRRRNCPVCGGKPDFAFLDEERGARWLLCSRCDMQWLFKRVECPYCGTQDNEDLSYMSDDQNIYRLYTCEKCHSYIKAIDLRQANAGVLLPLERVLTVDMDRQAEEAGYGPGWQDSGVNTEE